jgi:hypothetical protein
MEACSHAKQASIFTAGPGRFHFAFFLSSCIHTTGVCTRATINRTEKGKAGDREIYPAIASSQAAGYESGDVRIPYADA